MRASLHSRHRLFESINPLPVPDGTCVPAPRNARQTSRRSRGEGHWPAWMHQARGGKTAAVWGMAPGRMRGAAPTWPGSILPGARAMSPFILQETCLLPACCLPAPISSLLTPARASPVPRFNGISRHTSMPHRGGERRRYGPQGDEGPGLGCCWSRTCWGVAGPAKAAAGGPAHPPGDPQKRADGEGCGSLTGPPPPPPPPGSFLTLVSS